MMKPNTIAVINYLRSVNGQDVTAADVAEALGLEKRSVDGIFTSAIQKKELGYREAGEVVDSATGLHKTVKFLHLTDAGMTVDLEVEADAE